MQTSVIVIIALLLVVAAGTRANYVQHRHMAAKMGMEPMGVCSLVMDGCPMAAYCPGMSKPTSEKTDNTSTAVVVPVVTPPAASTSGFSGQDFMAHAREMDARKLRTGSASSPAKKMENLMMENDQAQRKLRSLLVRGG